MHVVTPLVLSSRRLMARDIKRAAAVGTRQGCGSDARRRGDCALSAAGPAPPGARHPFIFDQRAKTQSSKVTIREADQNKPWLLGLVWRNPTRRVTLNVMNQMEKIDAYRGSLVIPGGPVGVLLVHSLGGSPAELRFVAQGLARAGYTIY